MPEKPKDTSKDISPETKSLEIKSLEIKSYAKINLTLDILGKRPNGYHEIKSIFQAINLYDSLLISKTEKGYELTGSIITPLQENIVTRTKRTLETYVEKELPCKIHIIKNIPISSGLGGGSSNAAGVLVGLNQLYELNLDLEKLIDIGVKIGSDVPFFLANKGTALVQGIGEKIKPSRRIPSKFYVLARPHKRISTPEMYSLYDITGSTFLNLAKIICPEVKDIHNYLSSKTDKHGMSGTGPTLFAGFHSYEKAIEAVKGLISEKFNGDLFICRPVRNTYEINLRE